jgi:beta-mannosidase
MPTADTRHSMQNWQATAADGRETELSLPGVPSSFAGTDTVEYRTTLSEPRGPGEDVAVLTLRGLYAHAEVEVEGRLDGEGPLEHDCYFEPLRVPFVPDWETELLVTCHAPEDRFGGVHDTDRVPDEQTVPGVWWDVSVDTGPLPYLEEVAVSPERGDDGPVLRVRTSVLTDGPCSERLTYSVRPAGQSRGGGAMERGQVEATGAGRTTVERTVSLRDPAPWWPRGFGEQNRHVLRVKLGDQEQTVTFGIREVTLADGSLRVNGETVPLRGVNLLGGDPADVDRALEVSANLVRAHAHVPPATLYEACDEAGLLVWQDLPLTGPGTFDVGRGRGLAGAVARRAARHPSVAVYAAHDDPVRVASGLGDGLLDRLRLRWRAWRADYDADPATDLAAALPDPAIPAVGGPGLGCDGAAYYPGWRYGTPGDIEALLDRYPAAFVAEYGAAAPAPGVGPGAQTDERTPPWLAGGGRTAADDPEAARAHQARVVETVGESLRRERVGVVAFCLRDAGEGGFGVYSHDGEAKPARDALAESFDPVQAFLEEPAPGDSPVVVLNDTGRAVTATLRWRAGDAGDTLDVSVDAGGQWAGGPISIPATAETVDLELAGDRVHSTNSYDL